jgi:hypothetical protein
MKYFLGERFRTSGKKINLCLVGAEDIYPIHRMSQRGMIL